MPCLSVFSITLIPRVYTEISTQDADGKPLGDGFCPTNPQADALRFARDDSVIERYLRPHGIDWFHIGLDEVTGYMGIDPAKPFTVLEPWGQYANCRALVPAEQLQRYTVRVCAHLKAQGINHITLSCIKMRRKVRKKQHPPLCHRL